MGTMWKSSWKNGQLPEERIMISVMSCGIIWIPYMNKGRGEESRSLTGGT